MHTTNIDGKTKKHGPLHSMNSCKFRATIQQKCKTCNAHIVGLHVNATSNKQQKNCFINFGPLPLPCLQDLPNCHLHVVKIQPKISKCKLFVQIMHHSLQVVHILTIYGFKYF